MNSLQDKLKWFGAMVAGACKNTYHYTRANNAKLPYAVWAEDSESNSFEADNRKAEQFISGSLNYFTKREFDPVIDDLQEALNETGIIWALESVQYEPETGLIHYEWRWDIGKVEG